MSSFQSKISSRRYFVFFMMRKMPMAWLAGLRLEKLDASGATISVPYKWLTTNPFRSIYFACLAMAAELSSGILLMNEIDKSKASVSMLVVELKGNFIKKASETVYFSCLQGEDIRQAIERAIQQDQPQQIKAQSVGTLQDGTEVCRFEVLWSVKKRRSS